MSERADLRRRLTLAAAVDPSLPLGTALVALHSVSGDGAAVSVFAEFFDERGDHDTAEELRALTGAS